MCGGGAATPGCGRPAVVRGRPVGLWGKSSGLLARGALLLARWSGGVLRLGPGDQVSRVSETRSGSLLRFVEWAAKQKPALLGGQCRRTAQRGSRGRRLAGGSRLAAMRCSGLKRQLGAEHSVDEPFPRLSLRQRGLVMALEDGARVGDSNNGSCIVLKGGLPSVDGSADVRQLLYLLEKTGMELTDSQLAHKLALKHWVLNA
jgi:hypothetical protein